MKLRTLLLTATAAAVALASGTYALRQDDALQIPVVEAGPEHAVLKAMVGEWDASIDMMGENYTGKYTCRLAMNDLWLLEDYEGDMMGQTFVGHGVTGYDPAKGKYVGIWIDSMTASLEPAAGTWDAEKRELTMLQKGPDPMTGELVTMKQVTRVAEDGRSMSFHMFMPGPDGSEMETLTIHYTRAKETKKAR